MRKNQPRRKQMDFGTWERQYRAAAKKDRYREISRDLSFFEMCNLDPREIVDGTVEFVCECMYLSDEDPEGVLQQMTYHTNRSRFPLLLLIEPQSPYPWARLTLDRLDRVYFAELELNATYLADAIHVACPGQDVCEIVNYVQSALSADYKDFVIDEAFLQFNWSHDFITAEVQRRTAIPRGAHAIYYLPKSRKLRGGTVLSTDLEKFKIDILPDGKRQTVVIDESCFRGLIGPALENRLNSRKEI